MQNVKRNTHNPKKGCRKCGYLFHQGVERGVFPREVINKSTSVWISGLLIIDINHSDFSSFSVFT